jgi:amino acid permease
MRVDCRRRHRNEERGSGSTTGDPLGFLTDNKYMGPVFFFCLTCPSNASGFVSGTKKVLKSLTNLAFQNAGREDGDYAINTFIFAACLSVVKSSIDIGSRTILFMAQDGRAPGFLGMTDEGGVAMERLMPSSFHISFAHCPR